MKYTKKTLAVLLSILLAHSTILLDTGNSLSVNNNAVHTLAPSSAITSVEEFKEFFIARTALLAHEAVNEYIGEYLEPIVPPGADISELSIARKDSVQVDWDEGSYEQPILIISIEGLLSHTGQLAHVGLGNKNKMPTIYIDSEYFFNETILKHDKDEISKWEKERRNRHLSYSGMREWIKKYINTPEPLSGKTSREIADTIHLTSHNADSVYERIRKDHPDSINYDSVYKRYLSYPRFDNEDSDVNIAAGDSSTLDQPDETVLKQELEKIAEDPQYELTPEKIDLIVQRVKSGNLQFAGEEFDIITVDEHGIERVIGTIDAKIAHEYELLHRTANAFIIMPDGKVVIQRRVHNKAEPLRFTIPGGHVTAGSDYLVTVKCEVIEELGLPMDWVLQGHFHMIGKPGSFSSEESASSNNKEKRSLYFYYPSDEEAEKIREYMTALESMKRVKSKKSFAEMKEREQASGDLHGEAWGIHEFDLDTLVDIANGKEVTIEEVFTDETEACKVVLTDDLLKGLLLDEEVVSVLKNAIEIRLIDRTAMEDNLKLARKSFFLKEIDEAEKALEKAFKDIKKILSIGCDKDDPLVALYYKAKIMDKMIKGYKRQAHKIQPEMMVKRSTQILLLDSKQQSIVLQRRGAFKRLFPDKFSVSANTKPKKGEDVKELAKEAVEEEVGVSLDPARFMEAQPADKTRVGRLIGHCFVPFTAEEEKALKSIYELMSTGDFGKGIVAEWNDRKRGLNLYSLDFSCKQDDLQSVAERITRFTGIEPLYPAFNEDHTSMLLYILNGEEERQIRLKANEKASVKEAAEKIVGEIATKEILGDIDSDDIVFKSWTEVKTLFEENSQDFAQDLIGPAFSDASFWEEAFPSVISIDDERAGTIAVSGGKGSNTHILRSLVASGEITDMKVPDSSVVTTYAYQRIVLADPEIRKEIESLEGERNEFNIKQISQRIREKIEDIKLPEDFKKALEKEFHRLGGDIYVRSSATTEDLKDFPGAGLAESYPHVINSEDVQKYVKKVWASLFLEGFINARNGNKNMNHKDAFMGVMLQKSVDPKSAGVVFTVNSDGRPVYNIEAQPGAGEGVVQGKGAADKWRVGFLADTILERKIEHKTYRVAVVEEGGTKEERIDSKEACMSDENVLDVARLVKLIQREYKKRDLADNLDVEFVLDKNGEIYIVQTRSKASSASKVGNEAVFIYKTVDESRVPEGTTIIELNPDATVAAYGAVTAKIQIVDAKVGRTEKEIDKHRAAITKPGVILITHHTNNEFNGVFSKLKGVITTDGNLTSHAAQNSEPLKIPCLVGAADAIEKLKQFDGQTVTIDIASRKVYLGSMPIKEEKRSLSIWNANVGDFDITAVRQKEPHEVFQRWETTQARRAEVFRSFPEDGHLRRRSNFLRKFQMDYYWRAWDRLTLFLNDFFDDRAPWVLEAQDRVVKWDKDERYKRLSLNNPDSKTTRNGLSHRIVRDDPKSIFYFIQNVENLEEKDLQALFDERWKGFQAYARFMNSIEEINEDNVSQSVDAIIDIFMWMHIGFWLDVTVTHLFAHDQLRYITPEYANVLKEEASKDLPKDETVDEKRKDVPKGKILKLSRVKDREITALVERIWGNPELALSFANLDNKLLEKELAERYPEEMSVLEGLSLRFKATSEHLDDLSDTKGYLDDIRGRVTEGITLNDEFIAALCMAYMDGKSEEEVRHLAVSIEDTNSSLYRVISDNIREILAEEAAEEENYDWANLGENDRAKIKAKITDTEIKERISSRKDLRVLFEQMKGENKELYTVLRGYLRVRLAQQRESKWEELSSKEKLDVLINITEKDLDGELLNLANELHKIVDVERAKISVAKDALDEYPRLKSIAALAHQEFLLREDGHHLIVPHQRKMARMMLKVGEKYTHILADPRKIFDISTDELVALLLEDDPSFIQLTFDREYKLNAAEKRLSAEWENNPKEAVANYTQSLEETFKVLDQQMESATVGRVKESYAHEKNRLEERKKWLTDTILMLELAELLNKRDVTGEEVKADVLLICGNDTLDVFSEAVNLYANGQAKKILISGGLGKGTLSLIRSALMERIPIRISDSEVVSHENHVRRLERLNAEGKLRTVLKVSEADIIKQIIFHMAEERKDAKGSSAKVEIKEEDILCEGKTTNIVEYFTNSRSILYRLRNEFGLRDRQPLKVVYMHDGVLQFRTKSLFETIYSADIESRTIKGISYTADQDIFGLRRDTVQEGMMREMFAMIIFSLAGHVVIDYEGRKGLAGIPEKYWEVVSKILGNYQDKERLRKLFNGQITGLISKESWFSPDIRHIVNQLPASAEVFGKGLLKLFGVEETNDKESEDINEKKSFAAVLKLIRDDEEFFNRSINPSKGINAEDLTKKIEGFDIDEADAILDGLYRMGILKKKRGVPRIYNLSDMLTGSMDHVGSLINAINHISLEFEKGEAERPLEKNSIARERLSVMRETIRSTVISHVNRGIDLDVSNVTDRTIICHIVADTILPEGQRGMLKTLEQDMRSDEYSEKVVCLSVNDMSSSEEFMAELQRLKEQEEARYRDKGYNVQFDVACHNKDLIAEIQESGIQALAFVREGEGDIVQLENIILALRALRTGEIDSLLEVYKFITGKDFIPETDDINEIAKNILFIIPVSELDVNEIATLNKIIAENIKTAA